jgi:hypothetical protein
MVSTIRVTMRQLTITPLFIYIPPTILLSAHSTTAQPLSARSTTVMTFLFNQSTVEEVRK